MAYMKQGEIAAFRARMRSLYFSNETIDSFVSNATPSQIAAVGNMLAYELEVRDCRKKERLLRKAGFPQIKSFEGYDFSQVALPDDYSVEALKELSFIDAAQDFVFYGQTGRGNYADCWIMSRNGLSGLTASLRQPCSFA